MNDAQQLADRYVAAWNATDPATRRDAIRNLWTEDGQHYVDTRQAVGYTALEERIRGSHNKNVLTAGNRFRAVRDARRLRNAVTFHWEMLPADSETVLATGLEVLIVNDDGRILVDYQFVVS
jgi:SnoaL-like domain